MANRLLIRDPSARRIWAASHSWCMACGTSKPDFRGFSVHHIIRGNGRSDEPCNYLFLCGECHDLAENHCLVKDGELLPRLTLGACLSLKKEREPEQFDLARCMELAGRTLELEPVPEYFATAFRMNRL